MSNSEPTFQLIVTVGEQMVSLREAVASVWSGQAPPAEFGVSLVAFLPHSTFYIRDREVGVSNAQVFTDIGNRHPRVLLYRHRLFLRVTELFARLLNPFDRESPWQSPPLKKFPLYPPEMWANLGRTPVRHVV